MLAKAYDYLDNYQAVGDMVPSIAGLADELGICEKTCYNWAEKFPSFLQSLERIKTKQHRRLLNGGLANELNPTIVKLGLTTNHGYTDKSATDLTSQGDKIESMAWEVITPNASEV
jgi:hypothetical protein